ncbi:MAG: hypothetical protein LBC30_00360 [Puniceicoccales bacterium]|jgi:hypothetical protein|nr:hypothetical protein [Puniceicoccales bacterium]
MSNDPSLSVSAQPGIQAMGGSREPSQVGNHPVTVAPGEHQPSQEATVSRTGHTSLLSRMVVAVKQIFTHHTKPPVVSSPTCVEPIYSDRPNTPAAGTSSAPPPVNNPSHTDVLPSWESDNDFDLMEYENPLDDENIDDTNENIDDTDEAEEGQAEAAPAETPAETVAAETPAPTPAETPAEPAAAETPAETVVAETPAPTPAKTPAAEAEYKTASLVIGETHVRIQTKDLGTLKEIATILLDQSKPLLDARAMTEHEHLAEFERVFTKLGFALPNSVGNGLALCLTAQQGWIGAEVKQDASSAQERPTPDAARIAGAKAFVATNAVLSFVGNLAAQCERSSFDGKKVSNARGQILQKLVDICNSPDLQVVTMEDNVSGNNVGMGRGFFSLTTGIGTFLVSCFKNEDSVLSGDELQKLAQAHGHEFVEQLVEAAYKFAPPQERPRIEQANREYCQMVEKHPPNLGESLFNPELRNELATRQNAIKAITENPNLTQEQKSKQIEDVQTESAARIQDWVKNNAQQAADGSYTVDFGHGKIIVNADQLESIPQNMHRL